MQKTDEWGRGLLWMSMGNEQVKGVQRIGSGIVYVRYIKKLVQACGHGRCLTRPGTCGNALPHPHLISGDVMTRLIHKMLSVHSTPSHPFLPTQLKHSHNSYIIS